MKTDKILGALVCTAAAAGIGALAYKNLRKVDQKKWEYAIITLNHAYKRRLLIWQAPFIWFPRPLAI